MSSNNDGYLAAVAIPTKPTKESIEADVLPCRMYFVGEYPDQATALREAEKAARKHGAVSYNVVFPNCTDYGEVKQRLTSPQNLLENYKGVH